jgi:hypothetical protein
MLEFPDPDQCLLKNYDEFLGCIVLQSAGQYRIRVYTGSLVNYSDKEYKELLNKNIINAEKSHLGKWFRCKSEKEGIVLLEQLN